MAQQVSTETVLSQEHCYLHTVELICKDALRMHIERANYQPLVLYNADKARPDHVGMAGK